MTNKSALYCIIIVLTGICFMPGCSTHAVMERDKKIKSLTASWQNTETKLLDTTRSHEALKKTLSEKNTQIKALREGLSQQKHAINQLTMANDAGVKKAERLREQNYDLEMMYETLNNRIVSLKGEVVQQKKETAKAVKVIHELKDQVETVKKDGEKKLQAEQQKLNEALTDKQQLSAKVDLLARKIVDANRLNTALHDKVAQLKPLQQKLAKARSDHAMLDADLKESRDKADGLERQLASVTESAHAMGVTLPEQVDMPTDWETIQKIAIERFEQAKAGQFAGDEVDIAAAVAVGVVLLLCFTSFLFALRLMFKGRKIRQLTRRLQEAMPDDSTEALTMARDVHEELGGQGESLAMDVAPVAEEAAHEPQPQPSEDFESQPTVNCELAIDNEASMDNDVSIDNDVPIYDTVPVPGQDEDGFSQAAPPEYDSGEDAKTEVFQSVPADGATAAEDMSNTQVISAESIQAPQTQAACSPHAGKPAPSQSDARDDDVLGDLRNVINKKFDELLKD